MSNDVFLMHKAEQSVSDKKNLIRHILVYVGVWVILAILQAGIVDNVTHPSLWRAQRQITELTAMRPQVTEEMQTTIDGAVSFINGYFRHNYYTPPMWYFITGVMFAWGCWIAFHLVKRLSKRIAKKDKPDPVLEEYNRLKSKIAETSP